MTAKGPLTPECLAVVVRVSQGMDGAEDLAAPFSSTSHALRWYQHQCEVRGGVESSIGRQIRVLEDLGVHVQQSRRTSRAEYNLWLAARVALCLPRPRGPEPVRDGETGFDADAWTDEWLVWAAFIAVLLGSDVADIARRVEQWSGHAMTWKRAQDLTRRGLASFRDALSSRGLLDHGSLSG